MNNEHLPMWMKAASTLLLAGAVAAAAVALPSVRTEPARASRRPLEGIHEIRHVIVIMQENRSFDSYFGTFPGADGIPMKHGVPAVCVSDPTLHRCDRPYHDPSDLNHGGPHGALNASKDIAGGKMDGFIAEAEGSQHCVNPESPWCRQYGRVDVMGYHDAREIPNYWA